MTKNHRKLERGVPWKVTGEIVSKATCSCCLGLIVIRRQEDGKTNTYTGWEERYDVIID